MASIPQVASAGTLITRDYLQRQLISILRIPFRGLRGSCPMHEDLSTLDAQTAIFCLRKISSSQRFDTNRSDICETTTFYNKDSGPFAVILLRTPLLLLVNLVRVSYSRLGRFQLFILLFRIFQFAQTTV